MIEPSTICNSLMAISVWTIISSHCNCGFLWSQHPIKLNYSKQTCRTAHHYLSKIRRRVVGRHERIIDGIIARHCVQCFAVAKCVTFVIHREPSGKVCFDSSNGNLSDGHRRAMCDVWARDWVSTVDGIHHGFDMQPDKFTFLLR